MGLNTTVLILNDGFDQLEKHPEQFVAQIKEKMLDGGDAGVGNHGNCAQVMRTAHASHFRLYGSHGNLMIELSPYSNETLELADRRPDLVLQYIDAARTELDLLEEKLS